MTTRSWTLGLLLAAAAALAAAPAAAAPPTEGDCPTVTGDPDGPFGEAGDVGARLLREGMILGLHDLMLLRTLVPPEVWAHREAFFFEGMRMEIGPCHRRYPVPAWYAEATLAHWEDVRLDEDGNLRDYRAGLPFPLDRLDPDAPDAGIRWAWNLEHRYRGAAHVGSFRLTDMPSRIGSVETYEGSFFLLKTRHRADLPQSGYELEEAGKTMWVAGGRFDEPFHARHLAWRQLRPERSTERFKEADRTWVYVPDMRKPKRSVTAWIDGIYTPRYSSSNQIAAGGPIPFGTGSEYSVDTIQPTGGVSGAATENIRRGFVGLALRPNAYEWRYVGEQDVLAPLNGAYPGYPDFDSRNFGPSGLSVANDRWEVRRAVVIEGRLKRADGNVAAATFYVDYQTQQPLYYISRRKNGLILDVGILVSRFSGDDPGYPTWPDGRKALVFDPVAAAFYTVAEGGTGWRRESYDLVSVPVDAAERRRMTSVSELTRGR